MTDFVRLHPDDREAIAQRTAELMRGETTTADCLLTARQVAERVRVKVGWVYENAEALGGVPVGRGTKPRKRFDPAQSELLRAALDDTASPMPKRRRVGRRKQVTSGLTAAGNPLLPDPAGDV